MRQPLSGLCGIYLIYLIRKKEGFSWEEKAFTSLRKDFGKTLAKPQHFSVACLVFLRNHQEALTPADLLSCQQKKKKHDWFTLKVSQSGCFHFFLVIYPKRRELNPTDLRILPSATSSQATIRKAEAQASWMNKEPWWFPRQRRGRRTRFSSHSLSDWWITNHWVSSPDSQLLLSGTYF